MSEPADESLLLEKFRKCDGFLGEDEFRLDESE